MAYATIKYIYLIYHNCIYDHNSIHPISTKNLKTQLLLKPRASNREITKTHYPLRS